MCETNGNVLKHLQEKEKTSAVLRRLHQRSSGYQFLIKHAIKKKLEYDVSHI